MTASWDRWGDPEMMLHRSQGTTVLESAAEDETTPTDVFVKAALGLGPNLCPARDGAQAVAFTEAVYHSAAERAFVRIDGP